MHIAIDIDGTITKNPDMFREIAEALAPKHKITALTGGLSVGTPAGSYTVKNALSALSDIDRRDQLIDFGLPVEEIYVAVIVGETVQDVAKGKGEYCRDEVVDLFIDDSEVYLRAVSKISPSTYCLKVWDND